MRFHISGYRADIVNLFVGTPIKPGTIIKVKDPSDRTKEIPAAVSLGPICFAKPPQCSTSDTWTTVAGARKRIAALTPSYNPVAVREFTAFCKARFEKFITPADILDDVSFKTWLGNRPYPESRKAELRVAHERVSSWFEAEWLRVKGHVKDESYIAYKHARLIMARVDEMKTILGPYVALLEKIFYEEAEYVKHIPVRDRPAYITQHLGPALCYGMGDFTSMEGSQQDKFLKAGFLPEMKYALGNVYKKDDIVQITENVALCKNKVECRSFWIEVLGLCSGEVWTSLMNGTGNKNSMLFHISRRHLGYIPGVQAWSGTIEDLVEFSSTIRLVIEGDDSLIAFQDLRDIPSVEDFAELGFTVKMEIHSNLSEASFCGIVFDPVDCINVTDPVYELANFGWTNSYYRRANDNTLKILLRCKSLSLMHQYPRCPILQAMGNYGLRMTIGVDILHYITQSRKLCEWDRTQLKAAYDYFYGDSMGLAKKLALKSGEPGERTRELVARLFGVPVLQQRLIEDYFDNKNDLSPIDCPYVSDLFPADWLDYFERFNYITTRLDKNLDRPVYIYGPHANFVPPAWWDP